MGNDIQIVNNEKAALVPLEFNEKQVQLIKDTVAKGTTNDQLSLFLYTCKKTGLDPLVRQIHCVVRNTKNGPMMSIQTGIDGYRLLADRSGKYAGNDDPIFDDEKAPKKATVTVYKIVNGIRVPFTATARWEQYYPGDLQGFMWKKMPHLMLGKCAEALALRKAFPAELSGVYTNEEMEQANNTVTHSEPSKPMRKSEVEKVENAVIVDDIKAEQEAKEKEEIARKVAEQKAKLAEYNIKSASEVKPEVKRDSEDFAATPASQDPSLVTLHGHVASYKAKEGKKPHSFYIDSTWAATYDDNIAETLNTKREALVDVEVVCFKTVKTVNGKTYENLMIKELVSRD